MGYLPNPQRVRAWGFVLGGKFANLQADQLSQVRRPDSPEIVAALDGMAGYRHRYGLSELDPIRSGEPTLARLLAHRRQTVVAPS